MSSLREPSHRPSAFADAPVLVRLPKVECRRFAEPTPTPTEPGFDEPPDEEIEPPDAAPDDHAAASPVHELDRRRAHAGGRRQRMVRRSRDNWSGAAGKVVVGCALVGLFAATYVLVAGGGNSGDGPKKFDPTHEDAAALGPADVADSSPWSSSKAPETAALPSSPPPSAARQTPTPETPVAAGPTDAGGPLHQPTAQALSPPPLAAQPPQWTSPPVPERRDLRLLGPQSSPLDETARTRSASETSSPVGLDIPYERLSQAPPRAPAPSSYAAASESYGGAVAAAPVGSTGQSSPPAASFAGRSPYPETNLPPVRYQADSGLRQDSSVRTGMLPQPRLETPGPARLADRESFLERSSPPLSGHAMSALDRVFIRVYSKDQTPCRRTDASSPAEGQETAVAAVCGQPVRVPEATTEAAFAGADWYRMEHPSPVSSNRCPTPNPHMQPPSAGGGSDRSTQRRRKVSRTELPNWAPADSKAGDPETGRLTEYADEAAAKPNAPPKALAAETPLVFAVETFFPGPPGASPLAAPAMCVAAASATDFAAARTPGLGPIHVAAGIPVLSETPEATSEVLEAESQVDEDEAAASLADDARVAEEPGGSQPSCIASWEVDRFAWPETCEELCRCEAGFFTHAGEKLQSAVQLGLGVLAVASSHRGEGCSTLAICLARSAAKAGVRVALMDADFRSTDLAASLGVQASCSWPGVAAHQLPLSEAAVRSLDDGLTLMPLVSADRHAALKLDDPLVTAVIRQAASAFDLVIIDVGPIADDRGALFANGDACPVDAAVLVRDVRSTAQAQTLASAARFRKLGIDAVGIAENFGTSQQAPIRQPLKDSA